MAKAQWPMAVFIRVRDPTLVWIECQLSPEAVISLTGAQASVRYILAKPAFAVQVQNLVLVILLSPNLNFLTIEPFTGKVFYFLIKVILGEQACSCHTHKQHALFENMLGFGVYVNLSPSVNFQVNSELECWLLID